MEELVKLLSKLQEYLQAHYTGKEKLVFRQAIPMEDEALVLEQTSAKEEQGIDEDRKSSLKFFMEECDVCEEAALPTKFKKADYALHYSLSKTSTGNLDKLLNTKRKTFSEQLFEMIDAKELSEVQVYTKANLDRRLFSKMRRKDYTPSKNTVFALIIAMKLNMAEAKELLTHAGYAFKPSSAVDMIVSFFIEQGEYDIFVLNEVLDGYGLELLGNAIK